MGNGAQESPKNQGGFMWDSGHERRRCSFPSFGEGRKPWPAHLAFLIAAFEREEPWVEAANSRGSIVEDVLR